MIAYLRGRVLRRESDSVTLDVQDVGYEVYCTIRAIAGFSVGDSIELHIHTALNDDAIRLYGFTSVDELRVFRLLIGVERIGPKAGLAILGRAELAILGQAIIASDAALLATVPGVGRKTAERIVLELHDKLDWLAPSPATERKQITVAHEDAVVALVGLGFRNDEATRAVSSTSADGEDTAAIIAAALRVLDRAGQ